MRAIEVELGTVIGSRVSNRGENPLKQMAAFPTGYIVPAASTGVLTPEGPQRLGTV